MRAGQQAVRPFAAVVVLRRVHLGERRGIAADPARDPVVGVQQAGLEPGLGPALCLSVGVPTATRQ
jgi:hypothetical protein